MARSRAQSSVKWVVWIAVMVALFGGGTFLMVRLTRPMLTVTEAVEGPVVQAFYSTGTIQPEREYPIKSNTAGTITEVMVDKGDAVKKGQVLLVVTNPELQFLKDKTQAELDARVKLADEKTSPILAELEARLSATNELLAIARREQARVSRLLEQDAASQTDLDRAIDRVKQLWSEAESYKAQMNARKIELEREVEVARAALATAEWNLEEQTLESPIDGVVLDRPTSLGTRVAINDQIMRIANVDPRNLVMRAAVDEEDKAMVDLGQRVDMTLYSFPGQTFQGTVSKIYDQADAQRRTFEIDVKMNEPHNKLSPGMTGELAFILQTKDQAIVVPSQSLQGGKIRVVRDGKLVTIDAEIGLKSVERIEIVKGLQPGDRVVISPIGTLDDGQSVRTTYMDPAEAAGLNRPKEDEAKFKGFN